MQQATPSEAVTEAKRRLREEAKVRRSAIPPDQRQQAANQIAANGLAFLPALAAQSVISAFLPIGEELSPLPIMKALWAEGHAIGLPVMIGKGKPLQFRAWAPGDPLKTVTWGIREPQDGAPVVIPDVLLTPLLAFDRSGNRLGYGGGFYDRTLKALRERGPVTAVGLAFAEQEVDAVPHLDYDERLDWVLTPKGPIHCHS